MIRLIAFAVVLVSLTEAAAADTTPSPPLPSITIEVAALYGRTLGAALECPEISADRVKALTERALAHLRDLAPDRGQRDVVGQRLSDAIEEGAQSVRNGEMTCAQAEADVSNLDYELRQASVQKP